MEDVEHEAEQESDDECEVYFLKPVNEYNIVDKIKEANKELFSDEIGVDHEAQQSRKVSFAANLEEYEPQTSINLDKLKANLGMDCVENNEGNMQKDKTEQKLEIIVEEQASNEIENSETSEDILHYEEQSLTVTLDNKLEETVNELKSSTNADDNIILDEICEEILIMDMESDKVENPVLTKIDSIGTIQRKMLKQITFDYTEEDDNLDNQSLTNLLISDNENEPNDDELCHSEYNCNESVFDDTDTEDKVLSTNTEYDEEDEEDKLSIIVASYLPDDMACDKTSLTSSTIKSSPRPPKFRKLPFNKRFLFRRKAKSSNAIGSCTSQYVSNNRRFMPPPEVTDLKLNYKTCCDFKNGQQNLPKYTGYISEYGLSKEQLIERERKLQQKQEGQIFESLKASAAEMRKMHDNERAFTTWLKNKMRFPINKTRNMFDVDRPFGIRKCTSVGGNTLGDDTKHMLNTTKYRSISAKFRKT